MQRQNRQKPLSIVSHPRQVAENAELLANGDYVAERSTTTRSLFAVTRSTRPTRQLIQLDINPILYPTTTTTAPPFATAMASARLNGKTIVITGASSGIGRSTAFEFARIAGPTSHIRLVLTARRLDVLQEVAAELTKEFGEAAVTVLPVVLDVSDPDAVRAFVPSLPAAFRNIDVLINNAYLSLPLVTRRRTLYFTDFFGVEWPVALPRPPP